MTSVRSFTRWFSVPAIAALLAVATLLIVSASADAAATPWGELAIAHLAAGTEPGQVNLAHPTAFAVDASDGSYYVADETKTQTSTPEYRIQRFNAKGEVQASISFTPPETKNSATGSTGVEIQLGVDPVKSRVYALIVYARRGENETEEKDLEREEKELEKEKKECNAPTTCYSRFPLDSEEYAAGSLYAFDYTGGKLVAAKTSSGEPAPILTEAALKDQGESPKEALLNPHGIAVDPSSGDLTITANEDEEEDLKLEKEEPGAEHMCRVAAQTIDVQETKAGELSGKMGARFVDDKEVFQSLGCGASETEPDEFVPFSPVMTSGGKLLAEQRPSGEEEAVWEVPETEADPIGETAGIKEYASTPRVLYRRPESEQLITFEPEGVIGPTLSFVPEGSSEGKLYLTAAFSSKAEAPTDAVLVLHYSEAGATPEATEAGWIGGAAEAGGGGAGCLIPRPSGQAFLVGGFKESGGSEGVVAFDAFEHEKTTVIDALQLGPGGNAAGCPDASVTAPSVEVKAVAVKKLLPNEAATFSSTLEAANALSVEWKFENTTSHKTETATGKGAEFLSTSLEHAFAEEGEYSVTEVVQTDNLAYPVVEATLKDAFTVALAHPKFVIEGKSSLENGAESTYEAEVEDENKGATPLKYIWSFGDGETEEGETQGASTKVVGKHTFHKPCSCMVTLEVIDKDGGKGQAKLLVTVAPDKAEVQKAKEEAEQKASEEAAKKAAEEETAKKLAEEVAKKAELEKAKGSGPASESPPDATLASSSVAVSTKGSLALQISCPSGDSSCSGTVTLRTAGAVSASHKKSKKAVLTLASGSFIVSGGKTTTVTLHISGKALALLERLHVLRASATVSARDPAGANATTQVSLTLRLAKAKGHKH